MSKSRPERTDMEFSKLVIAEMPLTLMAQSFREWFEREPWREVWRCPTCSPPDDYGAAGRYANLDSTTFGVCLICGTPLEPYWSEERSIRYFELLTQKPGFAGYVGKNEDGNIVAWALIYDCRAVEELQDLPEHGCYVDTFGFIPPYGGHMFELFEWGHQQVQREGVEYFVTRTHRDARYVKDAITRFGYQFLRASASESDREYWIYEP
ncbi:MAG TPA: hypothetical protein VMR75_00650 [Candidatus Saccharimonadales bacterium]|nr:hypothetical protein [Candidatus Saccharimonadales bacterium]